MSMMITAMVIGQGPVRSRCGVLSILTSYHITDMMVVVPVRSRSILMMRILMMGVMIRTSRV
jgi:hypothetical protein